jgi:acetylornithine/N-succinyldiaminopimelate aminotransferase
VRGRGLLIGLDLDAPHATRVTAAALERGFIINNCTESRVRLAPPLVLTEDQASEFTTAWPGIVAAGYQAGAS